MTGKAWLVTLYGNGKPDEDDFRDCRAEVVHAETRGQAKQRSCVSHMDDFVRLRAVRVPQFDDKPLDSVTFLENGWGTECDAWRCLNIIDSLDECLVVENPVFWPSRAVYCSQACYEDMQNERKEIDREYQVIEDLRRDMAMKDFLNE